MVNVQKICHVFYWNDPDKLLERVWYSYYIPYLQTYTYRLKPCDKYVFNSISFIFTIWLDLSTKYNILSLKLYFESETCCHNMIFFHRIFGILLTHSNQLTVSSHNISFISNIKHQASYLHTSSYRGDIYRICYSDNIRMFYFLLECASTLLHVIVFPIKHSVWCFKKIPILSVNGSMAIWTLNVKTNNHDFK